jgi:hypothetical protein
MGLRWGVAFGLSLGLFARSAEAKELYRLAYVRGPGAAQCPDESTFRAKVSDEIDRDPFVPDAPNVLTVAVRAERGRLFATVFATNAQGEERKAAEHEKPLGRCDQLLEDAAFSAAMVVDPIELPPAETELLGATLPVSPSDDERAPSASPSASVTVVVSPPRPPLPARPRLVFSLVGGAGVGSTPGISPAVSTGIGVRWPRFSLSGELRLDTRGSRDELLYSVQGRHVRGTFVGCRHQALLPWLGLDECVLVPLGWATMVGAPRSPDINADWNTGGFTWAVGVRGGLSLKLSSTWSFHTRLDFLYAPTPPVVRAYGQEVFRMSAASAALQIGLVGTFDVFRRTPRAVPNTTHENSLAAAR